MTVDSMVENSLDGTYDMCHENDVTSLTTVRDVGGCKPRCQDTSPSDMSDEVLTLEGQVKSSIDVVFEDNEVCTLVYADASNAESIMSSDDYIVSDGDSEQLYTLVNGLIDVVEEPVALSAIPAMSALLDLDELSFAEFGSAFQAGYIAEVVVIRPEEELNSSSLWIKQYLRIPRRR
ncbi:unnamed protein product [Peronospora belbahrii]|uniref:Cyclic nucleotide-binding domain-containing protein n=1 Tax=Peronospora belbahrii TaxID=622444 RepID=A0ABN8D2U2_9STRA|nr:unnamed protein product [Peronospora belbahrii]